MSKRRKRPTQLYHPYYWPMWLGLGLLYLISQLPITWQLPIGRGLGILGYYFLRQRRHIAQVNLQLCFPTFNKQQHIELLKKHFAALGMGIIETGMAWWMKEKKFQQLGVIEGAEHLEKALQQGRGVILLSAHFTTLEIAARLVGKRYKIHTLYREQKNRLFNFFMERARKRSVAAIIPRDDIRTIIKSLKNNIPIYYAADQDYGRKHSVFVPFFGIPAATITATTRLTNINHSPIVPVFHYRDNNSPHYRVVFYPALENFPSADLETDLTRVNQLIENAILVKPEQYLWTHRRFKTQPAGEKRPY
jgi:Kdo2-lipid IVA lauroyltransferase/acyltransferase